MRLSALAILVADLSLLMLKDYTEVPITTTGANWTVCRVDLPQRTRYTLQGRTDHPNDLPTKCALAKTGIFSAAAGVEDGTEVQTKPPTCASGKYGPTCELSCPEHCVDGDCDVVSAHCLNGCTPGYQGELCDKICPTGLYGQDCKTPCPINCVEHECLHTTGHCVGNCEPGFHGADCSKKCNPGTYGNACNMTCSKNCADDTCDIGNGFCNHGCKPGHYGNLCDKDTARPKDLSGSSLKDILSGPAAILFSLVLLAMLLYLVLWKERRLNKHLDDEGP